MTKKFPPARLTSDKQTCFLQAARRLGWLGDRDLVGPVFRKERSFNGDERIQRLGPRRTGEAGSPYDGRSMETSMGLTSLEDPWSWAGAAATSIRPSSPCWRSVARVLELLNRESGLLGSKEPRSTRRSSTRAWTRIPYASRPTSSATAFSSTCAPPS